MSDEETIVITTGNTDSYTAMLKDLALTIDIVVKIIPQEHSCMSKLATLFEREIDLQLMVQDDTIKEYIKNRPADLKEAPKENVVPIKPKKG